MLRRISAAIAILLASACDRSAAPVETPDPSPAPAVAAATDTTPSTPTFTDRVWLRADAGSPEGAMQIFLGDGTLISDSCFETYRLSSWRLAGDRLEWSEDEIDIRARVVSVDTGALTLGVRLRGDEELQRFTAASAPYVCPDMPR